MENKANNKVHGLLEVLKYAREFKPNHFTAGERILIHQERVSWMHVFDDIEEGKPATPPRYKCPPKIQHKIKEIENWLQLKRTSPL